MSTIYDAIVIGGGVTGASTAYFLKKMGMQRVLLIERGGLASGGTGKSAAIVRQHYSTTLLARLALASMRLFETMPADLGTSDVFQQTGWLMLVPPNFMESAESNLKKQKAVGVETDWIPEAEWSKRFPWLNPEGIAGVIHEPRGGHADPVRVTEAFVSAFQNLGGEVRLKTPCRALTRNQTTITGIVLDNEDITAGTVVNAAGPWARPLAESVGLELPLRAVREQDTIWQARPGRSIPTMPISNAADAIYCVPQGKDRLLIGQGFPKEYFDVDPYNYKQTGDADFATLIQNRAMNRVPPLAGMHLISSYAALYDVTPDWYPVAGPRTGLQGYADASGGSGHGFKIAPAIGRELAQWICRGHVSNDFAGLSYDRFPANKLFVGSYGGNRG